MKRRLIVITVTLLFSAMITVSAYAGWGKCQAPRGGERYEEKGDKIASELGLAPEQDKLLKETRVAHREAMAGLRKELQIKHEALREALAAPGVTRQQVEPIANDIKVLQAKMVDSKIGGILKVKSLLTPEQYKKLQEIKDERKNGVHSRHDRKGR